VAFINRVQSRGLAVARFSTFKTESTDAFIEADNYKQTRYENNTLICVLIAFPTQ
jgi:hypothetical protein